MYDYIRFIMLLITNIAQIKNIITFLLNSNTFFTIGSFAGYMND